MSQKWMCVNMGMFVNPDNLAFQAALNAKIYVYKIDTVSCHITKHMLKYPPKLVRNPPSIKN